MSDFISRQAAIDALVKAIRKDPYYDSNEAINGLGVCDVRVILNDLPSAQPERKKGKWIPQDFNTHSGKTSTTVYFFPKCSVCGNSADYTNYCPACGADMRG